MRRPEPFQQAHVARRPIPYACGDPRVVHDPQSGGVVASGRTVWTRETYTLGHHPAAVMAFVDDLGIISLDPRWLVRADVLREPPASQLPKDTPDPQSHRT